VRTAAAGVDCITLTTNASRHHAIASLIAAQVSAIVPRRVRWSPRSCRIRASTGKAVIDIATPTKSMNDGNGTPGGEKGSKIAAAKPAPSTNGTMMLAAEIATVIDTVLRRSDRSSSRPTRNM